MIAEFLLCGSTIVMSPQNGTFYTHSCTNCITEYYSDDDEALKENVQKLQSFLQLKQGWNTYDAPPFSATHILNTEKILRNLSVQPKVFPTGRQSIQLEYEKPNGDYLEFEIFESGVIEVLLIINNKEKEFTIADTEIEREVDKFYAS